MAKLSSKAPKSVTKETPKDTKKNTKPGVKKTAPIETPEEIVGQDAPTEEKETPYTMTETENKILEKQAEEDRKNNGVSTQKMERAVEVIQDTFNLSDKGYVVNAFSDGGTKLKLSLANSDFEIAVTIKDAEKHGLL